MDDLLIGENLPLQVVFTENRPSQPYLLLVLLSLSRP